ncbi:MAG: hemolysin family protein [Candidatus Sumerlaeia bacterium]|nr:hemolysin family protein [Candidatus Sumerlaeia bacterium]
MMLEVVVVLLLLGANAFFALSEMSVVSSKRAKLHALAERGTPGAKAALALSDAPEAFLPATQLGITLVGILTGLIGGVAFAGDLAVVIGRVPGLEPYALYASFPTIVILLTYLAAVVGELVPKQFALRSPERAACLVAPLLRLVVALTSPFTRAMGWSSELILRLLGQGPAVRNIVTEEEVNLIMSEAAKSGTIAEAEQEIAERALRLHDRSAASIMTPRMDVVWLRNDEALPSLLDKLLNSGHSHFPVCRRTVDEIIGVLTFRDAVRLLVNKGFSANGAERQRQIQSLVVPPVILPRNATAASALDIMKSEKTHFAIVADEYGGLEGVVTNHDLLEALVGHVPGEKSEEDAIVTREDGSLLVSSWVSLDDVLREADLPRSPEFGGESIAAVIMRQMGRLPNVGEHCEAFGLRIEVVDKDGARVDRVLVTVVAPAVSDSEVDD